MADVLLELNTMMPTADIVAQIPFHDDFSDDLNSEWNFESNDDIRDDQDTNVSAVITLNLTLISYQIPMQPTHKRGPRGMITNHLVLLVVVQMEPVILEEPLMLEALVMLEGPLMVDVLVMQEGPLVLNLVIHFLLRQVMINSRRNFFIREDIKDNRHYTFMSDTLDDELHLGKFFRDKEHLKIVVGLYAMKK
uniref:Uncharacterized protein n=1 Tax=Cannabis sativa TaxID=3483 RepID=A0A803NWQ1_CANSA